VPFHSLKRVPFKNGITSLVEDHDPVKQLKDIRKRLVDIYNYKLSLYCLFFKEKHHLFRIH